MGATTNVSATYTDINYVGKWRSKVTITYNVYYDNLASSKLTNVRDQVPRALQQWFRAIDVGSTGHEFTFTVNIKDLSGALGQAAATAQLPGITYNWTTSEVHSLGSMDLSGNSDVWKNDYSSEHNIWLTYITLGAWAAVYRVNFLNHVERVFRVCVHETGHAMHMEHDDGSRVMKSTYLDQSFSNIALRDVKQMYANGITLQPYYNWIFSTNQNYPTETWTSFGTNNSPCASIEGNWPAVGLCNNTNGVQIFPPGV